MQIFRQDSKTFGKVIKMIDGGDFQVSVNPFTKNHLKFLNDNLVTDFLRKINTNPKVAKELIETKAQEEPMLAISIL